MDTSKSAQILGQILGVGTCVLMFLAGMGLIAGSLVSLFYPPAWLTLHPLASLGLLFAGGELMKTAYYTAKDLGRQYARFKSRNEGG
jgi:hypothetical protein